MKIPDLINELFESKEMSEYLIEHSAELSKYNILRMVCSAPIDIRRKAEILLEIGMHCLGCPASQMETLEEACGVHGIDVEEVLEKLNA